MAVGLSRLGSIVTIEILVVSFENFLGIGLFKISRHLCPIGSGESFGEIQILKN